MADNGDGWPIVCALLNLAADDAYTASERAIRLGTALQMLQHLLGLEGLDETIVALVYHGAKLRDAAVRLTAIVGQGPA